MKRTILVRTMAPYEVVKRVSGASRYAIDNVMPVEASTTTAAAASAENRRSHRSG
jgi:hypothetical protein